MTVAQQRELAALMDLLVAREPAVHYSSVRQMPTRHLRTVAQLRAALATPAGITCDCSESATLLFKLAGLKDPNGLGFDGYGGTGSMLAHLPLLHRKPGVPWSPPVGTLVVLGPGTGDHVCVVRKSAPDPLLFSHGGERGPLFALLSVEARFHRAPVRFLDTSGL